MCPVFQFTFIHTTTHNCHTELAGFTSGSNTCHNSDISSSLLSVLQNTYKLWYQLLLNWSRALLQKLTVTYLVKKFPHFMEPEGSLPHSQDPPTGPYSKPDESSPHHPPI
jgi:hypothetical protein